MRLLRKMQNKRTNIADIDAQKTHALGPDGTYGDLSHKTLHGRPSGMGAAFGGFYVAYLAAVVTFIVSLSEKFAVTTHR